MGIVAIDLFCGCGGVTYGLRKAGIRVAVGVDINPDCRLTYKLNNPGAKFIASDLRKVSGRDLLTACGKVSHGEYLMLAACAPCQPFSNSRRTEVSASERTILQQVGRLVRELRPDFLFLENVPGIKRVNGFSAFRRLLHTVEALNYTTAFKVIDAESYGVPQTRKRLVLLASRRVSVSWPEVTHGSNLGLAPLRTVRNAIGKYPTLRAGETHPTIPNHMAASISELNIGRLRATPLDGGSRTDWPRELTLVCHKRRFCMV
jgi:DNA (cytosine-5)-methyltransferase 1